MLVQSILEGRTDCPISGVFGAGKCENPTTRHYKYLHKVRSAVLASASNKTQNKRNLDKRVSDSFHTTQQGRYEFCSNMLLRRKLRAPADLEKQHAFMHDFNQVFRQAKSS